MPDNAGRAGIGTPAQLREHLRGYEKAHPKTSRVKGVQELDELDRTLRR